MPSGVYPRKPKPLQSDAIFGRLTVVKFSHMSAKGDALFACMCSCGKTFVTQGTFLRCGSVISCGCARADTMTRHGHARGGTVTPEYKAWHSMHQRCENPIDRRYKNYGARGISVCAQWKTFDRFLDDMGKKPSKHLSLERNDNMKGYSPSNCCWATAQKQAQNTRRTKLSPEKIRDIRIRRSKGQSLRSIAKIYDVTHSTIHAVLAGEFWSNV